MEQVLAGRYVLGDELGAGGMARVVRARDIVLDRWVAVKLLPSGVLDPTARERFRREARSSASFNHPNAVAVFDAGEDAGQLFLVMELVDGPSLASVLHERGRLRLDDALHIADGVLAALAAAHAAGLVHRDVKPGNVLLGSNRQVKLADFGIARRLDDLAHDLTAAHTVLGTPRYTSPEQLAGQPATPASDLYAVGVVLFEMLAGAPPYGGPSATAVAAAHQTAPIPDVSAARPDVPPVVASAVTRALAKDPAARFPSAAAMRAALASGTTAYPAGAVPTVTSTPDGPRRQSWWWVAAAALLIVGVTALVWATRNRGGADAGSSGSSPTADADHATGDRRSDDARAHDDAAAHDDAGGDDHDDRADDDGRPRGHGRRRAGGDGAGSDAVRSAHVRGRDGAGPHRRARQRCEAGRRSPRPRRSVGRRRRGRRVGRRAAARRPDPDRRAPGRRGRVMSY